MSKRTAKILFEFERLKKYDIPSAGPTVDLNNLIAYMEYWKVKPMTGIPTPVVILPQGSNSPPPLVLKVSKVTSPES